MEYARKFARTRAGKNGVQLGDVGTITLTLPDGEYTLAASGFDKDGNPVTYPAVTLPAISVQRLIDQSLSPFVDSYAGLSALADARAEFAGTVEDFQQGRYRARTGAESIDPIVLEIRVLTAASWAKGNADSFAGMLGEAAAEFRTQKGDWRFRPMAADDVVGEALDKAFARQKPAVREETTATATANAAARDAAREAARAAKAGVKTETSGMKF